MVECEDCNEKEAEYLVYDTDKAMFFFVCPDCLTDDDKSIAISEIKQKLEC